MVQSAAIWVHRALELPALTRRENAIGRRARGPFSHMFLVFSGA